MPNRILVSLLVAAVLAPLSAWGQDLFQEVPGAHLFSGQMIVRPLQLRDWRERGLSATEADVRLATAREQVRRFPVKEEISQTGEFIIKVPAGRHENGISAELMATGLFQYVQPDWIVFPAACPNDPGLDQQWHHDADHMQSCDAWDLNTGSSNVVIGIVDVGVLVTHQDLLLNRRNGYNSISGLWESQGGNISPLDPHGTITTGAAAANGNNGVGVSGVGWNLGHRMLRPTDGPDGAFGSEILECVRVSAEAGDKVVSCSWGYPDDPANRTTATYVRGLGTLLFWAAGNDHRALNGSDRDDDDLIVVGNVDIDENLAFDSAYGTFVDLVAPGVNIYTTSSGSNSAYITTGGTSLSCPLAAGLAGLIWSRYPNLTPDQVEAMIKIGCEDTGAAGVDGTYGYGRINSYRSLRFSPNVYVDFTHTGYENGTFWYPYNTFSEGYAATPAGGTMALRAGTSVEHPTAARAMTIFSWGGTARIGQ
jgi:subtilisin family serine protease